MTPADGYRGRCGWTDERYGESIVGIGELVQSVGGIVGE